MSGENAGSLVIMFRVEVATQCLMLCLEICRASLPFRLGLGVSQSAPRGIGGVLPDVVRR